MVFTSASDRFQLRLLRLAAYQKVLHHPSWARKRFVRRKTGSDHVHENTTFRVPGCYKLDKWVKTYGAQQSKSWLPYEWFDIADKLDYNGLPPYWCRYSQLRNSFALTPACFSRAGDEDLRRLVGVLQQSGCYSIS